MKSFPWTEKPVTLENFRQPPRDYGILPFWFLNGELDEGEMRWQLRQFREKGMPGIILHGRYGLEMDYLGDKYLQKIRFAVEEAEKLGLKTWIYDEMNWPSGTADKRVLKARPDLAQRYIECINFETRGPWFTYLTGADSRYLDFERSTPVAAFAVRADRNTATPEVIDLTRYLSFKDVIPWEAPEGLWRLIYIVEKQADYYIDALNPASTREYLQKGYDPYATAVQHKFTGQMPGFYTDEPAMHYYLTGGDNPILPWTADMFRRFRERNGYDLRPRLPDLFFDLRPDSSQVRYDFHSSLTEFYSSAFYGQIQEWCHAHNVLFTGHLLYEESLRKMVRVEGNLFSHYKHFDVIGVDHLYPIIGSRDRPDEHVSIKVASSAAHQFGSPRLLCESFGGIFMDATMQRMKWIADWEYVLGVNLLNPHGFHYTLEGARKRDWPPSQFYQYPWWRYYGEFSKYISRLSHMLSGGKHAAKTAVLWPLNAIFATYLPQAPTALAARMEADFYTLTDSLLRCHYDFDYLDEDALVKAGIVDSSLHVGEEDYSLLILPPMTHIKLATLEKLEEFARRGGRLLGMVFLPDKAFSADGLVDISGRMRALFGVDAAESQRSYRSSMGIKPIRQTGNSIFLRSYALARRLPYRLQEKIGMAGMPENPYFRVGAGNEAGRYFFTPPNAPSEEITAEVLAERQEVHGVLLAALNELLPPEIAIDNPEVFSLHRIKDGRSVFFLVNPTFTEQRMQVTLQGEVQPLLWDPSTGCERPAVPLRLDGGKTHFPLVLPPTGSMLILSEPCGPFCITDTNFTVEKIDGTKVSGYAREENTFLTLEKNGKTTSLASRGPKPEPPLELKDGWDSIVENENTLIISRWRSRLEQQGTDLSVYIGSEIKNEDWLPMGPGAWSYQLPAEPEQPYPLNVWYRLEFQVRHLPSQLSLIIDGFSGTDRLVYVNGTQVTAPAARSQFDSQMQALDITRMLQPGKNVLAVRLSLACATDGLLDLVKLVGNFRLEPHPGGGWRLAKPRKLSPFASWTTQGYPFYSGAMSFTCRFTLPAGLEPSEKRRLFLHLPCVDDALEVTVNGQPAGTCLWGPYEVEVSQFLQPGENTLELRVANTLVNQLEAVVRPSGLCGVPSLVAYNAFTFEIDPNNPGAEK